MGYHTTKIPKGKLGEFSKIQEEFLELLDGYNQKNKILEICELADLIGSIKYYIKRYNLDLTDLIKMSEATESAFQSGERS
jgi:hypothetical protein